MAVRQAPAGNYWNGTAFASSTVVWLPAKGTTTWNVPLPLPATGSYVASVKATDKASAPNTTGTPLTVSFVVDQTPPPAPTFNARPDNPTLETSARFSFSDGEAGVTFQCGVDGAAFATCAPGVSYSNLSVASHAFYVRAVDGTGNVSQPASLSWTVATTNFSITGNLSASVYPGMTPAPLELTFTNPYSFPLIIAGADVHVDVQQQTYRGTPPTTNSECPVVIPGTSPELRNLVVTGGSWAAVSIPAKSTRSLSQLNIPNLQWPHVQMPNLDRNQDGCKNTTFLFTYTGTATK